MRILLAEDDAMIGEAITQALKDASYAVDWVRDGQAAMNAFSHQHYDAVLLDLGLPKKDGIEVLRALRANRESVPILIISARDSLNDRIQGLDSGADDYILKPFEMAELLARIRVTVRRNAGIAAATLSNGILSLDLVSREVTADGMTTPLSAREFSLLQALLIRPGAILSRVDLEDRIYGWNEEVESNAVEFLIHSLRKKLGSSSIRNVRGVGWMVSKSI
jgi:two-component system, OmpR family, response regulator